MRSRKSTPATPRRAKPDDTLSSVLKETPIAGAVELLKTNTPFCLPSATAWVVLRCAASDIGGLSKKYHRDQAKGSIIELINDDKIQTVVTAQMLDDEVFCIIPTASSLERMEEYSLLVNAPYQWMVLTQPIRGELDTTLAGKATFTQARDIQAGTLALRDVLDRTVWVQYGGEPPESAITDPDIPVVASPSSTTPVSSSIDDELFRPAATTSSPDTSAWAKPDTTDTPTTTIPTLDTTTNDAVGEPLFDDGVTADTPFTDDTSWSANPFGDPDTGDAQISAHDTDAADIDDEPDSDDQIDQSAQPLGFVDQTDVRQAIARRFLTDDLDLTIPLDEFDTTFGIGAPAIHITVPPTATEWLGGQVAQLTEQANADLATMRQAHHDELRMLYVKLMTGNIEDTIHHVDLTNPNSHYKTLIDAARAERDAARAHKNDTIHEQQEHILAEFDKTITDIGEQARLQAITAYRESHRPAIDRRCADVAQAVDHDIDDTYTHTYRDIITRRRHDAQLNVERGKSKIFNMLADKHRDYLDREQARLDQWNRDIITVIDQNRSADIARAETLAAHQHTVDEIALLRHEHDQRIAQLQADHRDAVDRLTAELDRSRTDAITAATHRDQQWQQTVQFEQSRATDLMRQLDNADQRAADKADSRIARIEADRDAMIDALNHADRVHTRSARTLIMLMIALCVLGIVAGFVAGVGYHQ